MGHEATERRRREDKSHPTSHAVAVVSMIIDKNRRYFMISPMNGCRYKSSNRNHKPYCTIFRKIYRL